MVSNSQKLVKTVETVQSGLFVTNYTIINYSPIPLFQHSIIPIKNHRRKAQVIHFRPGGFFSRHCFE